MFLSSPHTFRFLISPLCAAILVAAASSAHSAPSNTSHKATAHKHGKTHSVARTATPFFKNIPIPDPGELPNDDSAISADSPIYELHLYRAHTGEQLDVIYRIGDVYIPDELDLMDDFLHDNHDESTNEYDPRLFDLFHTLLARLDKPDQTIEVLSAYRSEETNEMLRKSHRTNAAKHSLHIAARAIDFRIPGVPALTVRNAALSLEGGGVGYYPRGQFCHLDVGPVRKWTFSGRSRRRTTKHKHPALKKK